MSPDRHRQRHWNDVYASRRSEDVSWYQAVPSTSLELIDATGAGPGT